jgi:two-component system LytT family response regulator
MASGKITALIVDDEEFARENLRMLVEEFCEDVRVSGVASSAKEARQLVEEINPDLLFLDIMMPGEDGFHFLESVGNRNFEVIFTTAFRDHALRAIKHNALDYLEKPIDVDDLMKAVEKAKANIGQKKKADIPSDRLTKILQEIAITNNVEKTVVPTRDGLAVIRNIDIIRLEADENYTTLFCVGGKKYVSSKGIRAFEEKLDPHMFMRVHKSYIINMAHHLKEFSRTEGNIAVMSDGAQVPVARRKLQDFLDKLERMG